MNDDLIFKIIAGAVFALFLVFAGFVLFHRPAKWTTDLPHATCETRSAGESYRCVEDGSVYLCVDDWGSHHRACAKLPAVTP